MFQSERQVPKSGLETPNGSCLVEIGRWPEFEHLGVVHVANDGAKMGNMKGLARRWPLIVAAGWALLWLGISYVYHINEPAGIRGIANPPALTLYQRNSLLVVYSMIAVILAFFIAAIDVEVRQRRHSRRRGRLSVVAGSLLVVFSLFGFVWGLVSVGVVGLLILVASRPATTSPTRVTT